MARSYSVSFNINGALDGSLLAALRNASQAMRGLGQSARAASSAASASRAGLAGLAQSLGNIQNAAAKFRDLKTALRDTQNALSTTQSKTNSLAAQFNRDKRAAEELKQKLESLQAARRKALDDQNQARADAKNLRAQREALKAQARALGATPSLKIPRELFGTAKANQLSALLTQITAVQNQLKSARATYQEQLIALKDMQTQIRVTAQAYREASRAMSQSGSQFATARNQAAQLKAQLQQQQAALHQLRTQLGAAGFSTSHFAESEARLASEINRVNAALERQRALAQSQQQASVAAQEMFNAYNNFRSALQTAEQMASPFKTSLDKATEFERVMSEVKALTQMDNIKAGNFDVVEREMAALQKQALDLGAATIYTSQQVGEAQAYIARTGWKQPQIERSVPIFLELAASQHMDIARTADLATNIMTAFGHTLDSVGGDADKFAKLIQHDADVMAYTVTHSNQNFEQYGEAMKYAAPIAKQFGATIEEASMMTKFMADAGIQGSMAGTSMRQTMLRLVAPPKRATKAMQQYGITLDDANASWQNANAVAKEYGVTLDENLPVGRQFINVMRQIDQNMKGASDREKLGAISAITGINAVSGAANLFGAGANQAENFTQLLEQCDGALNQTYQVMTDNTYGATKSLESAWEAVQLAVGRGLLRIARSAANFLSPLLIRISEFINAHPGVVQACAAIAAGLAGIIVAAAAVQLAFAGWKFVATSIGLVSTALGALGSGALLGGLIERLALLRTLLMGTATMGGLATLGGWKTMFAVVGTNAMVAANSVRTFFASLTLGKVASGIVGTLGKIAKALRGAAVAAMSFAFSPVGVALMALALAGLYCYQNWDKVGPVLSKIATIITGALAGALVTVVTAFSALKSSGSFDALISSASQLASIVGGALVKAFVVFLTVAASAIAVVIRMIGDLLKTIIDLGGGLADAFGKVTQGDFSGAFSSLQDTASKTLNNIKNLGSHVWDGVVQGAENVQKTLDILEMAKMPTAAKVASHRGVSFDENGVAHSATEAPAIDTTATQANLDAVGEAAGTAATNMDGINAATQQLSQAGTDVQTLSTNAQTASTQVQAVGNSSQTSAPQVNALGVSADGAQGNVGLLGDASGGSVGNILAMSDAAGQVATALSAKATEIGAIHITVPQVSVAPAAAAPAASANYMGGIYRKGAFLTTFAERSPEAAIPLDNSTRARDLWTQAGQILGMLPKTQPVEILPPLSPPTTVPEKISRGQEIPSRRQSTSRARRQRLQLPPMTQTQPTYTNIYGGDTGSLIAPQLIPPIGGGLIERLIDRVSPQTPRELPTINLTVNVTVQGTADEATVQRGVEAALPAVEDWRRRYAEHLHEERRRAF